MADQHKQVSAAPSISTKRKRKANFTATEVALLTEMTEPHLPLLSSKFTNSVTNEKKKVVWANICQAINAQGVDIRTCDDIKEKWQALQKNAKAAAAEEKRNILKTGGGQGHSHHDPITDKIIAMYSACPTWTGIEGGLETSAASAIPRHAR
jgi:hypothetical protein